MRELSELKMNECGKPVRRLPPTEEVINEFQSRFRIALPEAYLQLLRYSNGGHPELDSVEPASRSEAVRWAVNRFHFLDNDRTSSGSLWAVAEKWRSILGEGSLPFASDAGGNQFFLDLKTSPARVKLCLHDENFAIVEVAPAFEAFIDRLSADPDMI